MYVVEPDHAGVRPATSGHVRPSAATVAAAAAVCRDTADLIARHGDPDSAGPAADLVRAEADRVADGDTHAIVIGETKRGKTSLVNALIGRERLLPVDEDIATGTYVLVRGGAAEVATVYFDDDRPSLAIDTGGVAHYTCVDPVTLAPREPGVAYVDVTVAGLRSGLVLVDTPGVHGLVAGHTQTTLAALVRADAVLFVVSGRHELTAPELRFLAEATTRIAAVIFVVTQVDKHPGWAEVVAVNRSLILQHAPRYTDAPWYAVSSPDKHRADAAEAAGDLARAERLRRRSGFAELNAALSGGPDGMDAAGGLIADTVAVRLRNALHVARGLLGTVIDTWQTRLDALVEDPTRALAQQSRETALTLLNRDDATWRTDLDDRFAELDRLLRQRVRRGITDLRYVVEDQINTAEVARLARAPGDLDTGVRGLWSQIDSDARQGVAKIAASMGHDFKVAGATAIGAELALPEQLDRLPPPIRRTAPAGPGFDGLIPAAAAGSVTFAVLSILTGGVLVPVAVGGGVLLRVLSQQQRRNEVLLQRSDAIRYLTRVVDAVEQEASDAISASLGRARNRLSTLVEARLRAEREGLAAAIAAHRDRDIEAADDRAARRTQTESVLRELRAADARLAVYAGETPLS